MVDSEAKDPDCSTPSLSSSSSSSSFSKPQTKEMSNSSPESNAAPSPSIISSAETTATENDTPSTPPLHLSALPTAPDKIDKEKSPPAKRKAKREVHGSQRRLVEEKASRRLVEYFIVISAKKGEKKGSSPSALSRGGAQSVKAKQNNKNGGGLSAAGTDASRNPTDKTDDSVGSEESPLSNILQTNFHPVITSRYPLEDHGDNRLNPMVTHFCHPDSRVTCGKGALSEVISPRMDYLMPKIHHFVLTNDRGKKMYGTCLTIYEPYKPSVGENTPRQPKVSKGEPDATPPTPDSSIIKTPDSHEISRKNVPSPPPEERPSVHYDDNLSLLGSPLLAPRIEVTMSKEDMIVAETDFDVNGPDHERSIEVQPFYLPCCLCILSSWPYLTAFREYLTQLYRLYFSTSNGSIMLAPLERYIINLCSEIAAPPPGVFEVQCTIFNSVVRFWAPPANQPIAWVALPFSHLFSCLSITNVLQVWHALALERQVLLVSSQNSLLTVCSEILISLLFPMTWSHLYIPVVPNFLTPMLDAPMPYLCGVGRENYRAALLDVSKECIVVDLDTNTVTFGVNTPPLAPIPARRKAKLLKAMDLNVGHVFLEARCTHKWENYHDPNVKKAADEAWQERLQNFDEAFNLAFTPDSPNLLNESGMSVSSSRQQSAWDAVQEAFLRFYVAVLRDYRKYLIFPNKDDRLSERGFRRKPFLASQKLDYQPFVDEFLTTQQFDVFLTKRLFDPGEADVTFFDQSIDAKLNRSKFRLNKVNTPFLRAAHAHKKLKTIVAVEPNTDNLPPDWKNPDRESKYERTSTWIEDSSSHRGDTAKSTRQSLSHPKWPEVLDSKLFGEPRPLPSIVDAEFDRQGETSARLRSKFVQLDDSFYDDCDPSPEVGTFTVFFIAFTEIVGRDLISLLENLKNNPPVKENWTSSSFHDVIRTTSSQSCPGAHEDTSALSEDKVSSEHEKSVLSRNVTEPNSPPHLNRCTSDPHVYKNRLQEEFESSELEEARVIAQAQLDLAFDVLRVSRERNLITDPDAYNCLMEACGRCGDTVKATWLMKVMRKDGCVADSVIYSNLVGAFSVKNTSGGENQAVKHTLPAWANGNDGSIDWNKFRKNAAIQFKARPLNSSRKAVWHYSSIPDFFGKIPTRKASSVTDSATGKNGAVNSPTNKALLEKGFMSGFYNVASSLVDTKPLKPKDRKKPLLVTEPVLKQVALGENLLEFLYPGLAIDTGNETCPQCSKTISEDYIVFGWKSCDSQDYTTTCPRCTRRFVARFSVKCESPSFMGSQGPSTPLYCEFLSPWVLRKELRNVIRSNGGIKEMMSPSWRNEDEINATLWWNMMVSFMRYRLPITFLLQGSVNNRLIMPSPDS